MKHLLKKIETGTQCMICMKTWKTKPRKDNCPGLPPELAVPSHLVFRSYFEPLNQKPKGEAIACLIDGKYLLYDKHDYEIENPNFPPIFSWDTVPRDLYQETDLLKWNLEPGNANPKAAIWIFSEKEWLFFYDKKDCEINDPTLPPCYDKSEIPQTLKTAKKWNKTPNYIISDDAIPQGCYRFYKYESYYLNYRENLITVFLYSQEQLVWEPDDKFICKTTSKKAYLLSNSWIKRIGKPDIETTHDTYKTPIYLYSRKRVEQFIAENVDEYVEWLDKRDKYIEIFEQNREKILAGIKLNKEAKTAKIVADTWQLDDSKKIVKEQMVKCFTCTYGYGTRKGFVCNAFHTNLRIDQMPCPDWEEKS